MENTNERQIKTTGGYFDVVGDITIDAKTITLSQPGKNNPNWIQNVFNPKIEANDGKSMFMRFSSGYDKVKGKTIFTRNTQDAQMEIQFADRTNPNIISLVNEKSFIRLGVNKQKVKDDATGKEYMAWNYKQFLDTFDLIQFLQEALPINTKVKVQIRGVVKFSTYNGEVQRNYEIQSMFLLTGNEEVGKEMQPKLEFNQSVLLVKDCVDTSKLEEEGIATVSTLVMVKEKKEFKTIPVKFLMKATNDKQKAMYSKLVELYFNIPEDKVRKMNLECIFEVGYVAGNVSEDELPQEAKDLIELGVYTIEEVVKMYANKERVDNLLIKRPHMKIVNEKPVVDMSDEEYTLADLEGKSADVMQEEVVQADSKEMNNLLDDLNNL